MPRPFVSYEPFRVPYADTQIQVTLDGHTESVQVPAKTQPFTGQISYDSQVEYTPSAFGTTVKAPLGARVHARSGDKGSNANVGFWVVEDDEYQWIRSFLSIERLKLLLGDDLHDNYVVERFEIPNLRCVHFLVKGVLEGGISSSYKLDGLVKSFGEFLSETPSFWKLNRLLVLADCYRLCLGSREVDIPGKFLERGRI